VVEIKKLFMMKLLLRVSNKQRIACVKSKSRAYRWYE